MPTTTSSQSSMSLPPIPPPFQKNNETAQKKTSSVFQGSKTSTTSSSTNTDNEIFVLYSQMKSYMEQQNKTNQKILREIEDIKKQKRPTEDQYPLMPRVLDFVTPTSTTQQSRGSIIQPQGSFTPLLRIIGDDSASRILPPFGRIHGDVPALRILLPSIRTLSSSSRIQGLPTKTFDIDLS
ncbi:hypothetical protein Hanom_Chr06g00489561 [Helianthus anomalus]